MLYKWTQMGSFERSSWLPFIPVLWVGLVRTVFSPAGAAEERADAVVGAVDARVAMAREAAHCLIWATRYLVEKALIW